jgi:hypothetical protein
MPFWLGDMECESHDSPLLLGDLLTIAEDTYGAITFTKQKLNAKGTNHSILYVYSLLRFEFYLASTTSSSSPLK